jgi:putative addiction module killer protein
MFPGASQPVLEFILRVHSGPGYRVYFGVDGVHLILLNGGTKNTQAQDIVKAKRNWQDYNA